MEKGKKKSRSRPAIDPDAREDQLIALAMNVAEEQLRNGTATSQIITHFLDLGTAKKKLELENLKVENELKKAKIEAIKSGERTEELYREALSAMTTYRTNSFNDEEFDDE